MKSVIALEIVINPSRKLVSYNKKSFPHDLSSLDMSFLPAGTSAHSPQKRKASTPIKSFNYNMKKVPDIL